MALPNIKVLRLIRGIWKGWLKLTERKEKTRKMKMERESENKERNDSETWPMILKTTY